MKRKTGIAHAQCILMQFEHNWVCILVYDPVGSNHTGGLQTCGPTTTTYTINNSKSYALLFLFTTTKHLCEVLEDLRNVVV